MNKERILILTTSKHVNGHYTAAKNLYAELTGTTNATCKLLDTDSHRGAKYMSPYSTLVKKLPLLWRLGGTLSDKSGLARQILLFDHGTFSIYTKDILRFKPTIVIHTNFTLDYTFGAFIRKVFSRCHQICLSTDYGAVNSSQLGKWSDTIITVDTDAEKKANLLYPKRDVHTIFFPVDELFWITDKRIKKPIKILFYAAWNKSHSFNLDFILPLIQLVKDSKNFELTIVCGSNKGLLKKLQPHEENSIEVYGHIDSMPSILRNSTVCVSKPGGAFISECFASTVPVISYTEIPCQEEENITSILKHNLGWKVTTPDELLELLRTFPDDLSKIEKKVAAMVKYRDKLTSTNITEIVTQISKRIG